MKEVVVDTSVVIKWLVPQPDSAKAHDILDAYENNQVSLLAPDLLYAEVGNVIWKLQRFQGISQADAIDLLHIFQSINVLITPSVTLLNDAYQIASTHQRTVYDSLYIALSLRQGCPLITADEKLANSVRSSFPHVLTLSDWS